MKCPHCGAELQENACFCLYCMEQLDRKEQRKPIKKRKIRWLLWLAIAALLIAVILLLSFCKNEKQTKGNAASVTTIQRASQSEEQTSLNNNELQQTEPAESESVEEERHSEQQTEIASEEQTEPSSTKTPTEPTSTQEENRCEHEWEDMISTLHHEEVGHYEEVCVDYEKVLIYGCVYCSAEVDSFDALVRHFENTHSNIDNYEWHLEHLDNMCKVIEKWVPIYEMQWIVDEPAYDETIVTGQKCGLCGIEKR